MDTLHIPDSSSIDGDGSEIYEDESHSDEKLDGYLSSDSYPSDGSDVSHLDRRARIAAIRERVRPLMSTPRDQLAPEQVRLLQEQRLRATNEIFQISDRIRQLNLSLHRAEALYVEIGLKLEEISQC